MRLISLFLFVMSVISVDAKYIFSEVTWKKASSTEIALFVVIVAIIILALIFVPKILFKKEKKQQEKYAANYFNDETRRLGMTSEDKGWATQLCGSQKEAPMFEVLQSPILFEKAVHSFLASKNELGSAALSTAAEAVSRIRFKIGFKDIPIDHPLVSTRNIPQGTGGALYSIPFSKEPLIKKARVMDGGEIFFVLSIAADEGTSLKQGQSYRFMFTRKGDAAYSADVAFHSVGADGLFRFAHTLSLNRQQSRKFARVDVRMTSDAKLLSRNNNPPEPEQEEAVNITFVDLSAGGASFVCEKPFFRGDTIAISVTLRGTRRLTIEARVLRTETLDGAAIGKTRHHIEFQGINDSLREQLVRYVLDKQLQQRKLL